MYMVLVSGEVGPRLPVLALARVGAGEHLLADGGEDELGVIGHGAGDPSMPRTTLWVMVGVAHRNSPVSWSSV